MVTAVHSQPNLMYSTQSLEFSPPSSFQHNPHALWIQSAWKLNGIRVWVRQLQPGENACLFRVGRYGQQQFYSWNMDYYPLFL